MTDQPIEPIGKSGTAYKIQFYYTSCKFPVFSLVKERVPV